MNQLQPKPGARDGTDLREQESLLVRECIRLMGRSLEPDRAIREMLHLLSELLGLNRGRVVLPDPARGDLAIRYAYGLTAKEVARGRYALREGITGRVMQSGEPLLVQDIDGEPAYLARAVARATLPQETVSFIVLPIEVDGRVGGVLGVHRLRSRHRQLADDMAILRTVATLIGQILQVNRLVSERTANLEDENRRLRQALEQGQQTPIMHGIVGRSPLLARALRQLEQVAGSDASVLLLGESGTGKELFAQALHRMSARAGQSFVKVNCAAIPDTLFEAELFGHEKGAFTGAVQARAGRFEQADGGTLFLDEIGDLPLNLQVKLLRVLQEQVIERVGSQREIRIDVRIVAATHRDLQKLVAEGRFRADLFYRLNVIPIQLPSLRERPEDIKHLVLHFLEQLNVSHGRQVALQPGAMASLVAYPWPGNIRQLYNVLERVVLLAEGSQVGESAVDYALVTEAQGQPLDIPQRRIVDAAERTGPAQSAVREWRSVGSEEAAAIRAALSAANGNKSRAAQVLGLTLRQLNYRIAKLGLS
jgi:Nif-specific regulatory protein